jgi:hypothetical protein
MLLKTPTYTQAYDTLKRIVKEKIHATFHFFLLASVNLWPFKIVFCLLLQHQ